ncbi:glucose dehydrogenase [FAD, quinone] isoform X1 [Bombyx mori]|uniref:Glucose-methanol-choline oxidoreductase N-terminal domain-containing protein n=1 Tax=Bombyx mori TaxID=7091 RepID=A0A8R1WEU7_BOMMO|nr:glucose dehydrogenase [FAD, quinone] isoform X1 [Bombyx mori]
MNFSYCVQFFIFSVCVHIVTLFTYIIYYSDIFASIYLKTVETEYDYIIVGSGTAGSIIAHRIATETNYTYIVLEAGSKGHGLLDIPVLSPFLHKSVYDWNYETSPQENACWGMVDHKCRLPQGKIVGGSSKLNNMVHVRGNISHYADWFHRKYSNDYIKKQFEFVEKHFLHLDDLQYESKLVDSVLSAATEFGYKILESEFDLGFTKSLLSQRNGKRWSTSDNLDMSKVFSNFLVEEILFIGNTAVGVKCSLSNQKIQMYAKKGVILSAGTLNTPKILQLSGIGPAHILKSLGIPIVKDLPVGKNLQDHVTTGLDLVLFNKTVSISALDMINPINAIKYFIYGTGSFTSPGCEILGFLSTKKLATPNIQFMVLPVGLSSDRGSLLKNILGIKNNVWNNYFNRINKYATTILPIVLHPKSKGTVYINSTDPRLPPVIDPKYLSSTVDRRTLIDGLKLIKEFVNTESMKKIGATLNDIKFPGCEDHVLFTDEYFNCYIKHLTLSTYHPIGTCSMGPPTSKNSVVDTSFNVIGVNRLHVVDASVLPTMPSGNINAAVAMMASLFFETNLKSQQRMFTDVLNYCYVYDWFIEYVFRICLK